MHRNLFAIWFSVALICPSTAFAQANPSDADAIVDAWAAAFNECSPDKLAALYDPAATLWGTNSPTLATTQESVRSYFAAACAQQPPIKVSLGARTTRGFGCGAVSAGTYSFVRDGKPFPARFSFTLISKDGKWVIVQHHSSPMPVRP